MAFGMNSSYLKLTWLVKTNEYYLAKSPNFDIEYPSLHEHLFKGDGCPPWVALGPEGTFFCPGRVPGRGEPKHNLPSSFPLKDVPHVRIMWLGFGGAWVVLEHSGRVIFDLRGHYDDLKKVISKADKEIDVS